MTADALSILHAERATLSDREARVHAAQRDRDQAKVMLGLAIIRAARAGVDVEEVAQQLSWITGVEFSIKDVDGEVEVVLGDARPGTNYERLTRFIVPVVAIAAHRPAQVRFIRPSPDEWHQSRVAPDDVLLTRDDALLSWLSHTHLYTKLFKSEAP